MNNLKKTYAFTLPNEQIAHQPTLERESCKLLSLNKESGVVAHHHFYDIVDLLPEKSILVRNNTRVIHARIPVKRKSGAVGEVLIQKVKEKGAYYALARPSKRLKEGEILDCLKNEAYQILLKNYCGDGIWEVSILPELEWPMDMPKIGELPLPPYIKREAGNLVADEENYQTVFSEDLGSVAAPTASLHFTEELLKRVEEKGIEILTLTHHVGLGTFYPIRCEKLEDHVMHWESYFISEKVSQRIQEAKNDGQKIVALGTTVVRALESATDSIQKGVEIHAETNLFIYPPYEFSIVDSLITNFHLSESTLLMLVSAFAGKDSVLNAYNDAVKNGYRFFSYGDAMFIDSEL